MELGCYSFYLKIRRLLWVIQVGQMKSLRPLKTNDRDRTFSQRAEGVRWEGRQNQAWEVLGPSWLAFKIKVRIRGMQVG